MSDTSIEWATKSWNPTRGCSKVSAGCMNCYAMKQAHRFSGVGGAYEGLTKLVKGKGPQWTGEVLTVPHMLPAPLSWRTPERIFVNSMSDLFHKEVPISFIAEVFAVMSATWWHTHLVLTKRPDRMAEILNLDAFWALVWSHGMEKWWGSEDLARIDELGPEHPLPNVQLGTSVEDQDAADERIPHLLRTPAAVRFLSCEPLLGPVNLDLSRWIRNLDKQWYDMQPSGYEIRGVRGELIHWVIIGGESGPGARPFNVQWARDLVQQCARAKRLAFVKQLGAKPIHPDGDYNTFGFAPHVKFSGTGTGDVGVWLKDRKGGDMAEWPEDLRVRELPR